MSYTRHFIQVFQYAITTYKNSKGGVVDTAKNFSSHLAGYTGYAVVREELDKLLVEVGSLKPDKLPAFQVKIAELADQWIKTSFDHSTAAQELLLTLSYSKIKERLYPYDPDVQQAQLARTAYLKTLRESFSSTEILRKREAYLGALPDAKELGEHDLLKIFPASQPGKFYGTHKLYTYLTDEPTRKQFEQKHCPTTDKRLPMELQADYLWFKDGGKFNNPLIAMEELERLAGVHSIEDQLAALNATQAALAESNAALLKLTSDPLIAQGKDLKANAATFADAKITAANSALILKYQAEMQKLQAKHTDDYKALAKKIAELEAAQVKALAAEQEKAKALEADFKKLQANKALPADDKKLEDEVARLKQELQAKSSPSVDASLIAQLKANAERDAEQKYTGRIIQLEAELLAAKAVKAPIDEELANGLKAQGAEAEAKKQEATIAALRAELERAKKLNTDFAARLSSEAKGKATTAKGTSSSVSSSKSGLVRHSVLSTAKPAKDGASVAAQTPAAAAAPRGPSPTPASED